MLNETKVSFVSITELNAMSQSQTQVETTKPVKVFELRPYVQVPESSFQREYTLWS
jgi:hypothetical protein